MALLGSGVAAASDAPGDDWRSISETEAVLDAAGAPAAGTEQNQAVTGELQAALNAGAQTALTMINQFRAANGRTPWREDGQLTALAQAWATQMANERDLYEDPNLNTAAKPLPGYPVDGSYFIEDGISGYGSPTVQQVVEYIKVNSPSRFLDSNVNQIGIGWSVNGFGEVVLYWIAVEYTFNDIGPSDTFYTPVEYLAYNGITTGYPDGGFRPTGSVSREAMAAFLYRFFHPSNTTIPACEGTTRMFTDVTAGHPFCGAIEWLAGTGITTGYPDGTFKPGANVTREAMAAFLYRAVVDPTIPACGAGARDFVDVPASHPFCGAIEWLAESGITSGWPDRTFRPGLSVERQAMAAFLYRLDR